MATSPDVITSAAVSAFSAGGIRDDGNPDWQCLGVWYFSQPLIHQGYGIPLVVTVHSLEPLRPWKREQLRGGYDVTCWVEQTALEMADAVIAVSNGTSKEDAAARDSTVKPLPTFPT